jgi:uncharacterized UPF0160 family protein
MLIATHNGKFHPDEVFAIAILKLAYPNIKVIRTRDPEKLKKADMRVDIGLNYNPETSDFDHHQTSFKEKRSNNIPYASAGIVWKHFWNKITKHEEIFEKIDNKMIQQVDLDDNGLQIISNIPPYTLNDAIYSLKPYNSKEDEDLQFDKAVNFAKEILNREIERLENEVNTLPLIKQAIKRSNGKFIVLDQELPWREPVIKETKIQLVVYPNESEHTWSIKSVPVSVDSFQSRILLPKAWAGLEGKELQKVTGIKDAIFCHKERFVACTKSKESAIKLAELVFN